MNDKTLTCVGWYQVGSKMWQNHIKCIEVKGIFSCLLSPTTLKTPKVFNFLCNELERHISGSCWDFYLCRNNVKKRGVIFNFSFSHLKNPNQYVICEQFLMETPNKYFWQLLTAYDFVTMRKIPTPTQHNHFLLADRDTANQQLAFHSTKSEELRPNKSSEAECCKKMTSFILRNKKFLMYS